MRCAESFLVQLFHLLLLLRVDLVNGLASAADQSGVLYSKVGLPAAAMKTVAPKPPPHLLQTLGVERGTAFCLFSLLDARLLALLALSSTALQLGV